MREKLELPKIVTYTFILGFIIMAFYGLIIARQFLYPLALAVLFASLLYPVCNFLEKRWGFHRILANLVTILLAIVLLVGIFLLLASQVKNIIADLPALKQNAMQKALYLQNLVDTNLGIAPSQQELWLSSMVNNMLESGSNFLQGFFRATTSTASTVVIMPIYVFFMLFYRDKFAEFIMRASKSDKKEHTQAFIEAVSHVTENYMSGVAIVVGILMVVNSVALSIVGLDYAIFLGIVAALCNFIPYFGTILGFSFPLLFTLLTENSPEHVIGVIIAFIIIQFTENNILTPNIVGNNLKLNPFVIILGLIIGGMVWGIAGMLVVVPTIAVLKIYFDRDEATRPYAFLLGVTGTRRHSIEISGIVSYVKHYLRNLKRRKK